MVKSSVSWTEDREWLAAVEIDPRNIPLPQIALKYVFDDVASAAPYPYHP